MTQFGHATQNSTSFRWDNIDHKRQKSDLRMVAGKAHKPCKRTPVGAEEHTHLILSHHDRPHPVANKPLTCMPTTHHQHMGTPTERLAKACQAHMKTPAWLQSQLVRTMTTATELTYHRAAPLQLHMRNALFPKATLTLHQLDAPTWLNPTNQPLRKTPLKPVTRPHCHLTKNGQKNAKKAKAEHRIQKPCGQKPLGKLLGAERIINAVYYLGGISPNCAADDIVSFCRPYCNILDCRILSSKRTGTQAARLVIDKRTCSTLEKVEWPEHVFLQKWNFPVINATEGNPKAQPRN